MRADIRDEAQARNLAEQTAARFARLDAAINIAGIEGQSGTLIEQSIANYEATFSVNVLGTLLSLKHELRLMFAQGSGSIVNLSAIASHADFPGEVVYAASKHAIEGLITCASREGLARGVRVNASRHQEHVRLTS